MKENKTMTQMDILMRLMEERKEMIENLLRICSDLIIRIQELEKINIEVMRKNTTKFRTYPKYRIPNKMNLSQKLSGNKYLKRNFNKQS